MRRTLQPELLDSLPPDHPAALHNRRDLRLTNAIMGNHRWIELTLRRLLHPGERGLEIGAGTGELARRLTRAGLGTTIDGLDLWPEPTDWAEMENSNLRIRARSLVPAGAVGAGAPECRAAAWHVADLRAFDRYDIYDAIVGNLIFHQFTDNELADLGAKLRARARVIVAAEPARRRISQVLFRAIAPLLGANYVSLHDARVSIAAGFLAGELPRALGLDPGGWDIRCTTTALGAYRMVAVRRKSPSGEPAELAP